MATDTKTCSSQRIKRSCDIYIVYFAGSHYQLSLWYVVKMHYKHRTKFLGWVISNLTSHLGVFFSPNPVLWIGDSGFVWFFHVNAIKMLLNGLRLLPFHTLLNHLYNQPAIWPYITFLVVKALFSNPRVTAHTQDFLMQNSCGFQLPTFIRVKGTPFLCLPGKTQHVTQLDFLWDNITAVKVRYCQLRSSALLLQSTKHETCGVWHFTDQCIGCLSPVQQTLLAPYHYKLECISSYINTDLTAASMWWRWQFFVLTIVQVTHNVVSTITYPTLHSSG